MLKKTVSPARILILSGISLTLGIILASMWARRSGVSDAGYIALLREAYKVISTEYVEKPDNGKLVTAMVNGMLSALDPHSAYLPPEPYKEMEVQMSGLFGGIGIELGMKDGRLTVISPIDDTPAFRAGIHANDHIWKIDGVSTRNLTISAAVKRMRGEKGSSVILTILRDDSVLPLTFHLVRDMIRIKSLKSQLLAKDYGLIRIAQFQENTGVEFRQALQGLHARNGRTLSGLIIDLRFNPGGVLSSSIDVANCFLGNTLQNSLIVSTKGRTPVANREYHATIGTKEPLYPIVVLVNGGTASASEIVAGALQDHKRAVVVGKQSFGKGSVQSVIPMKGHAALKLTTARYFTPSGRSIQARGITPDIIVENAMPQPVKGAGGIDFKEKDLENRLRPLEEKSSSGIQPVRDAHPGGEAAVEIEKDAQLKRGLDLLRSLTFVKGERPAIEE